MNDYKVSGILENGQSYCFTVTCQSESMARSIIFSNFAKINMSKEISSKLMVASMEVTELERAGA